MFNKPSSENEERDRLLNEQNKFITMKNLLAQVSEAINKPEYIYRPKQILRRLVGNPPRPFEEKVLPWGLMIRFRPHETLGSNLWRSGVYELAVSETIWRLVDPGDIAIDVGANIGYMTSLMAARTGITGLVHSFEPHPEVYAELSTNVARWKRVKGIGSLYLHNAALSNQTGTTELYASSTFESNRGTASIVSKGEDGERGKVFIVQTACLDDVVDEPCTVGFMKIDAEGAELTVLNGCHRLLKQRRIRDIIFEDHNEYPTQTTQLLLSHGYTLFRIGKSIRGVLVQPAALPAVHGSYDAQNFLATTNPERVLSRLKTNGWNVLKSLKE